MAYPQHITDRFYRSIDKNGPVPEHCPELGQCWMWTGSKCRGYGKMDQHKPIRPSTVYAHRVSFELAHGKIPEGHDVLHYCDNPSCVRPEHLWSGTHQENMDDMLRKGRHVASRGKQNGAHTKPERVRRGKEHGMARLTEDDVRDIRRRINRGETERSVGVVYGICGSHAGKIGRRKVWKCVE